MQTIKKLLYTFIFFFITFPAFCQLHKKKKIEPPTVMEHGMGANLLDNATYQSLPHLGASDLKQNLQVPSNFEVQAPPPGDQLLQGSCVGWSIGYTFLSAYIQRHTQVTTWDNNNTHSPSFVYHFSKINEDCVNAGCFIHVGFECIRDNGSCLWRTWPYANNDCNLLPSANQLAEACSYSSPWKFGRAPRCKPEYPPPHPRNFANAKPGEVDSFLGDSLTAQPPGPVLWQAVTATDYLVMKSALVHYKLPIVIGFKVTNSFLNMWYNGGNWTNNDGTNRGGHSVCIIGYNDTKIANGKTGFFKCVNQWGSKIGQGDKGYFWISYDLVRSGAMQEAYIWVRDEPVWQGCPFRCPD
jgi:hypothetical protein